MKKTVSKLWKCFREHIGKILFMVFIVGLLLVALAVAVDVPENIASCLQKLLGLEKKSDVLKFIGFCVAGVVSIWLALSADKRANAMDATAKNTEAEQRQERLKNAIEHLGHKRDSVRMGGAYELFHLAKDTEGLRQTVMDILCAHIRQTTRGDEYQKEHKAEPSEEIQSLLTLLFMDEHDVFEDCSINLQGSYLNRATLSQARLKKADLRQGQLQEAILLKAQLQGAFLWGTQLQTTFLWEAQLQGAVLRQVRLQEADLSGAQMQGAVLREAQLQGADLSATRMQGATFSEAQLQGANLSKTQLQGADLKEAQLQGVSSQVHPLPLAGFESRIKSRIGKDSDLTGIIFAGGLQQKDLDTLCEGLSAKEAQILRETLRPHVGQPVSHKLPRDSGAKTGAYTQEEAEQWIAEYNKAMQKAPRAGDS